MNYTFLFQIFLYPEVLENFSFSEIMKLSTQRDSTSKQTVCLYWKIILAQYRGLDANIGPGCHSLVSGQACWLSISSAQKMAEWFVNSVEHCFTFYCFDHYTPEKPWIPLQRTISPSRWILIGGSFPMSLHCLSLRLTTCFSLTTVWSRIGLSKL